MRLDGIWAEWVEGVTYFMSPITLEHDQIQGWIAAVLRMLAAEKLLGTVLAEPFVFRTPGHRRIRSPDVMFVATSNPGQFEPSRFVGAPDLIVEVVSEDSIRRDTLTKRDEYELAGVREYLILDPLNHTATLLRLGTDGKFSQVAPENAPGQPHDGRLVSKIVTGFFFNPAWLDRLPLPSPYRIVREMGL